jgi:hypothetical protein
MLILGAPSPLSPSSLHVSYLWLTIRRVERLLLSETLNGTTLLGSQKRLTRWLLLFLVSPCSPSQALDHLPKKEVALNLVEWSRLVLVPHLVTK